MTKRQVARTGYLTVDALVGLTVTTIAVAATLVLAVNAITSLARTRDRLESLAVARGLYEDLYAGRRPDGQGAGATDGRTWYYDVSPLMIDGQPSLARSTAIRVDRRFGPDLRIDAVLPPAPANPSSSS